MCKTPFSREAFQLTPIALERHLEGMAEKLRSGGNWKVGESIEQSVARVLVGPGGSLTIEAKPRGFLEVEDNMQLDRNRRL